MNVSSRARAAALSLALAPALVVAPALAQQPPAPPEKKGLPPEKRVANPEEEKEFIRRVDEAVDRGDAWLQKQQISDGSYETYHFHSGRDYVPAQTALALLARIAAGENQHGPELARGFAWIKQHPPKYTYEVALVLMAFDARAAPVNERAQLERMSPEELRKYRFPRALESGDKEFLQPLVDRLARERYKECWSYGGYGEGEVPKTADASNTQFALLGLRAASRLGLELDRRLFADALNYFLDHQQLHGPVVRLVDSKVMADGSVTSYGRKVEARGFGYEYGIREEREFCASRACIGIACLVLSLDELLTKGTGAPAALARQRRHDVDQAIDGAHAWLVQNWAVDHHPPGESGYYYYYLYALERAGALTSRRFFGDHDWYREGAEQLLKKQGLNGCWPSGGYDNELVNTAFALLFLRRATLRASVTSGG